MRKIRNKIQELKYIKPSLITKRYGMPEERVYKLIMDNWKEFENPQFMGGAIHTQYRMDKMYYEVCDSRYKRGNFIPANQLNAHVRKLKRKRKKDQHVSTYQHCYRWARQADKTGSVGGNNTMIYTPNIWVELDRDSLDEAIQDSWLIAHRFGYTDHMKFYYSGNKSIHIAVDARLFGSPVGWAKDYAGRGKLFYNIAHRIASDVRHGNGISDPNFFDRETLFQVYEATFNEPPPDDEQGIVTAKKALENTDPALYSTNSLIRTENSIHEKGNKRKFQVSLKGLANNSLEPSNHEYPDYCMPKLLHWTFQCVEPKKRKVDHSNFKSSGKIVIDIYSKYIGEFDPSTANSQGFVTDLRNPLYEDSNGSCSVNLATGEMHDWGAHLTYGVADFLGKVKDIGTKKAESIIKNEQFELI
ncbi:hypothetical protein ACKGJO_06450 [Gracilimonas sp. Q87]|uniref:hypothetical protein n=1 Tax=Gracilimonas sp. Q87 TaxID=3384766 RepID=UPI003983F8F4